MKRLGRPEVSSVVPFADALMGSADLALSSSVQIDPQALTIREEATCISAFLNVEGNDKMTRFFGRWEAFLADKMQALPRLVAQHEENWICKLGL